MAAVALTRAMPLSAIATKFEQLGDSICPPNAKLSFLDFDAEYSDRVHPEEIAWIESSVLNRRKEFLTGRACARTGLKKLNLSARECGAPLIPDAAGLPQWPQGYVGSITHSKGLCAAIVSRESDLAMIAIDLEKTNRLSDSAAKRVMHPLEASTQSGCDAQKYASILFSLKEAFYKAQFPHWKIQVSFQDLALSLNFEEQSAKILELSNAFPDDFRAIKGSIRFRFVVIEAYVCALCWLEAEL